MSEVAILRMNKNAIYVHFFSFSLNFSFTFLFPLFKMVCSGFLNINAFKFYLHLTLYRSLKMTLYLK